MRRKRQHSGKALASWWLMHILRSRGEFRRMQALIGCSTWEVYRRRQQLHPLQFGRVPASRPFSTKARVEGYADLRSTQHRSDNICRAARRLSFGLRKVGQFISVQDASQTNNLFNAQIDASLCICRIATKWLRHERHIIIRHTYAQVAIICHLNAIHN